MMYSGSLRSTGCSTWAVSESAPSPIGRITLGAKSAGKPGAGNRPAGFDEAGAGDGLLWSTAPALDPTCVQRRLTRSVGGSPTEARASRLVAWMAGWRETKTLKPIDEAICGMVSESPGRNASEREMAPKVRSPGGRACNGEGEGSMARRKLAEAAGHSGGVGSDSTVTRARRATGEALLVPSRK
jgi:hypothetical protein